MSSVPLRVRLVGVVVLLSALALTLSGLAATTALRGYLVGRIDSQLSSTTSRLGNGWSGGGGGPDPLSDAYVEVIRNGTASSLPLRSGVAAPDLPSDLTTRTSPFTAGSTSGHRQWRVQVTDDDGVTLVVAMPLDGVQATMTRLVAVEALGGAGVLLLLAGVGYVVVRRSLRPLAQVELAAEDIAGGDLSQRVPEGHPRTEVGSLSRSFNMMIAQIETAFTAQAGSEAEARASAERMRRFVADASHELRTPLTSIRGFAELYRQGALPAGPDVDRAMARVEAEACRMGDLVDDLLLLARLDQQRPLEPTRVDLAALAADAVHDARATAPGRTITLQAGGEPRVDGDRRRLAQVLANLLGNALTHTPSSASVRVRVAAEGGRAVLEVADEGPGVADADKDRVFERFYRADASRTRASGGSGLGLSIVAGIVRAHGGEVAVHDTPGGGATFRIELPGPAAASGSPDEDGEPDAGRDPQPAATQPAEVLDAGLVRS